MRKSSVVTNLKYLQVGSEAYLSGGCLQPQHYGLRAIHSYFEGVSTVFGMDSESGWKSGEMFKKN